jgi:hypothetical protein
MIIAVAGPYTANTPDERNQNLAKLNSAALAVLQKGHIPLVGLHSALPILDSIPEQDRYEVVMQISMAVMKACEAILYLGPSKGADREKNYFEELGLPVFTSVNDLPVSI